MARKKTTKAGGAGRPRVLEEVWRRVTVILLHRQIVWLDRLAIDILDFKGTVISRAELIRAMIDAVSESDLNLAEAGNEAEVKAILGKKLGRKRRARGK